MIYTGKYENCKSGNLISISGDRGKKIGFKGKVFSNLAPKLSFWKVWEENIGKISELENIKYYINEYYKQVLINIDFEEIFNNEEDPIFLCYEDSEDFCHRHVLAEYLELKYGIKVYEVETNVLGDITIKDRPKYIREILLEVIKENHLESLQEHGCFNCEFVISPDLIDCIISENSEYRDMSYEDAIKDIGHCEVTPYEYAMQHDYHCEFYFPNSECLENCRKRKK